MYSLLDYDLISRVRRTVETDCFPAKGQYWILTRDFYNRDVGKNYYRSLWDLLIEDVALRAITMDFWNPQQGNLIDLCSRMNLLVAMFGDMQSVISYSSNALQYLPPLQERCPPNICDHVLFTLHEV